MRALVAAVVLVMVLSAPVVARQVKPRAAAMTGLEACAVTNVAVGEYATITATGLDPAQRYAFALHTATYGAYSFSAFPFADGTLVWGAFQYAAGPAFGELRLGGTGSAEPTVIATCPYEVAG